jgi:hypothetical protein
LRCSHTLSFTARKSGNGRLTRPVVQKMQRGRKNKDDGDGQKHPLEQRIF